MCAALVDSDVTYHLATQADVLAAADVIKVALDDLAAKQSRQPLSPAGDPMAPALLHVLGRSPERFWVAEADARVIGFGAGLLRGHVCYLAGLFILPEWQGRGVGHQLLRRAMEDEGRSDVLPVVGSSGSNMISNGLYARHGMYQQMPSLSLTGVVPESLRHPALGSLQVATASLDGIAELRVIDEYVTNIDRTEDHAWLLGEVGRTGWVFRRGGRAVGYAYLGGDGTVGNDHVGPVTALRTSDVATIAAFAVSQCGVGRTATVEFPGVNLAVHRLLWQAGFQMSGPVGLLGSSRPFGHFDRYIYAGNVLL